MGIAPVFAQIENERAIDGKTTYAVRFDLANDIRFAFNGPVGPIALDVVTSDLLDIALSVCFLERDLRKLALTNRVKNIHATIPVRAVKVWKAQQRRLEELLQFMGGHEWHVSFVKSRRPIHRARKALNEHKQKVVLHSGGMDSTCGLATLIPEASNVQLASFYTTGNIRSVQETIARTLNFGAPSQLFAAWRNRSSRRGRSAFAYRSFMFLSFAVLIGRSFSARSVIQFENGFMAAAIVPASNYFATKHAHPKYHRLFNELIADLDVGLTVENPFRWKTKREMVEEFYDAVKDELGEAKARQLLATTQSCWFYNYNQFPSRFERERIELSKGEHCGACIPCLMRRVAFRDIAYSIDPRRPPKLRNPANITYNFDAYVAFCRLVHAHSGTPSALRLALLQRGVVVDREVQPWTELHRLIVKFADEFIDTFGRKYAN